MALVKLQVRYPEPTTSGGGGPLNDLDHTEINVEVAEIVGDNVVRIVPATSPNGGGFIIEDFLIEVGARTVATLNVEVYALDISGNRSSVTGGAIGVQAMTRPYRYNFFGEFQSPINEIWVDGEPFVQPPFNTFSTNRALPSNDITALGLDAGDIVLFNTEVWGNAANGALSIICPDIPAGTYDFEYWSSDAAATAPIGARTVTLDIMQGAFVLTGIPITIGGNDAVRVVQNGITIADEGGGFGNFYLDITGESDNPNIVALRLTPVVIVQADTYVAYYDPFTSVDSSRTWEAGEPSLGGSPMRYDVPVPNQPTNDLSLLGLGADEIALFQKASYVVAPSELIIGSVNVVASGQYTIDIYLAEGEYSAIGQRVFEYWDINGVRALQDLDLWAYSLGQGGAGSDAQKFTVNFTVGPDQKVTIQAKCSVGNPFVNALHLYPRPEGQATEIFRNVGVNAADAAFPFTDSNGITWEADQGWGPGTSNGAWSLPAQPYTNLEEYGFVSADSPLFQSYRFATNQSGPDYELNYTLTLKGGFRYQVGYLSMELFGADRRISVLWEGVEIIPQQPAIPDFEIALVFGFLDLKGVSGSQTGTLTFRCPNLGTDNNPLICAFYVAEETTSPPASPDRLLFNAGGEIPRDFVTALGDIWNEDTPFLAPAVDETKRYTIAGPIGGLGELNLQSSDEGLIQDVRFNDVGPIDHIFQLETGYEWLLRLYLVEDVTSGNTAGGRVMDVYANNVQIAAGLDPFALAGGVYNRAVRHDCLQLDLTTDSGDFSDISLEVRQAAGANGAQPYPMVSAYEWVRVELSKIRELVEDDAGNPRTNETGIYAFVWSITQADPPIVGQLIAQTNSGETDENGYFEIFLPSGIIPFTRVVLGLSTSSSPEDGTGWSFFGPVVTRSR